MPVYDEEGPGGVNASFGRRLPISRFDNTKTYDNRIYIREDGRLIDSDGQGAGTGGLDEAVLEDGLAKVLIGESVYALLPVDASGDVIANVGHRKGEYADLISLDGVDGEISLPTDRQGFIIHNGVPDGAVFYPRLDNGTALGLDSFAIGSGATTTSRATGALALGPNAVANNPGEVTFGSAVSYLSTGTLTGSCTTVGTTPGFLASDGTSSGIVFKPGAGLYDVDATVLVREPGTNNWARFTRRMVVNVESDGNTTTLNNVTEPTPDIGTGLVGIAMSFAVSGGRVLYANLTGLAGKTLRWGMRASVTQLTN